MLYLNELYVFVLLSAAIIALEWADKKDMFKVSTNIIIIIISKEFYPIEWIWLIYSPPQNIECLILINFSSRSQHPRFSSTFSTIYECVAYNYLREFPLKNSYA